jgi:hypothetical protein
MEFTIARKTERVLGREGVVPREPDHVLALVVLNFQADLLHNSYYCVRWLVDRDLLS